MKNWNQYSNDHYLFVLSQAEKELDETVTTMKEIQSKSRFQLGLSISILIALVGWIIKDHNQSFDIYAWLLICILVAAAIFDLKTISNYQISTKGSSPDLMLDPKLYTFTNVNLAEKNLIYNEVLDYSDRIKENRIINEKRVTYNSIAFAILCSCPVFLLLAYALQILVL